VKLALTLPPELETRLAALAAETHREPQAVLVELVGEALERKVKLAALRSAIDEGDASGVAEDGVFDRVRERAGLPPRSR
jgi:predicted transcriptional regulator